MGEDSRQNSEAHARALIDKWRGSIARLWEYDVSLSRLVIRVESRGRPGNLHIICLGCEFVCEPVNWGGCSFTIEEEPAAVSRPRYVLRDEGGNFRVSCGSYGALENVEPYV